MARQVVQLKRIGKVTFSQNQRSKNIKLSVKADKSILISYPFYISHKEAHAFVTKNIDWISRQQEKMDARKTKINPDSELKTKLFTVNFLEGERNSIEKKDKQITIKVSNYNSPEATAYLERCLSEIYRLEAKTLLPGRLKQMAEKFGFSYNKVSIRNNRRNWGSCSSQNNISLNLQMMKMPMELIDYILLHELVHTEVKNHGPKFWERLNEVSSNRARELASQVKTYSTYTL